MARGQPPRYDAVGARLAMQNASGTITHTYDADHMHREREDGDHTTKYLWDAAQILMDLDADDATVAPYTLSPSGYGDLISQRRSAATSFCHFDQTGSARGLTDSDEDVTDTYLYDAGRSSGTQSAATLARDPTPSAMGPGACAPWGAPGQAGAAGITPGIWCEQPGGETVARASAARRLYCNEIWHARSNAGGVRAMGTVNALYILSTWEGGPGSHGTAHVRLRSRQRQARTQEASAKAGWPQVRFAALLGVAALAGLLLLGCARRTQVTVAPQCRVPEGQAVPL